MSYHVAVPKGEEIRYQKDYTLRAIRDFHVSTAIPEAAEVEFQISPHEILQGCAEAARELYKDPLAAYEFLRKQAEISGTEIACCWRYWFGMALLTGSVCDIDCSRGIDRLEEAARSGYPSAALILGFVLDQGARFHPTVQGDIAEACRWYALAAECGMPWAKARAQEMRDQLPLQEWDRLYSESESMVAGWPSYNRCGFLFGEAVEKHCYGRIRGG